MHRYTNRKVVAMSRYWTRSRTVSAEFCLEMGRYAIIPCCFEPAGDKEITFHLQVDAERPVEWYIHDSYTMKEFDTEGDSDCENEAGPGARGRFSFAPGVSGWRGGRGTGMIGSDNGAAGSSAGGGGEGAAAATSSQADSSPESTAVFAQSVSSTFEAIGNVHFELEKGDAAMRHLAGSVGTLAKDMADLKHYVSTLEQKLVAVEARR